MSELGEFLLQLDDLKFRNRSAHLALFYVSQENSRDVDLYRVWLHHFWRGRAMGDLGLSIIEEKHHENKSNQ